MGIAAVPNYLPKPNLSAASPALQFNMYLPIWDAKSWGRVKDYKIKPIDVDQKMIEGFRTRQGSIALGENMARFHARSVAPFVTGLGMEHPLENGFAFLDPYGIPYLAGSGVKGVLRRAAEELAHEGFFESKSEWTLPAVQRLFGIEPWLANEGNNQHIRGALSFWDVIPEIKGDKLTAEIMTPHQTGYLQGEESPHDSGQPTPIKFLTVPPDSSFTFHVTCEQKFLGDLSDSWRELLQSAFEHAFNWLGFGAKTAVGYGAMSWDHSAEKKLEEEENERTKKMEKEQRLAALPKVEREIQEALQKRPDKNEPESTFIFTRIESGEWKDQDKIDAARWLQTELGKLKRSAMSKRLQQKHLARLEKVKGWVKGE